MHRIVAGVAGDGGSAWCHNAGVEVFAVVHCHRRTAVLGEEAVSRKEGTAAAAGIEVEVEGTDTLVAAVAGTDTPAAGDGIAATALVAAVVVDMADADSVLQAAIQR